MKTLILNWRDPYNKLSGGAEVATLSHAKGLIQKNHTVVWFSSKPDYLEANETKEKIKYVRKGGTYSVYLYGIAYLIRHAQEFDLIVDEIHGMGFFSPLLTHTKRLIYIHEVAGKIWDDMFPFPINIVGKFIENLMFQIYKNETFLTVSNSTKKELVGKGINPKKIHVIENGVTQKNLAKLHKEKTPTFIFVSRLVRMKGIEDILMAFEKILKEKSAQLWVVGSGEVHYVSYLNKLVKKMRLKKSVSFFGFVTEKKKTELLGKSHILLHASTKEGWGLVVMEAALQKTPAIVYDVSGLRDSVVDGRTGVLTKKNTPSEMAKQALMLIDDKVRYERLSENAFNRAKAYTWEDSVKKSVRLFEEIAK